MSFNSIYEFCSSLAARIKKQQLWTTIVQMTLCSYTLLNVAIIQSNSKLHTYVCWNNPNILQNQIWCKYVCTYKYVNKWNVLELVLTDETKCGILNTLGPAKSGICLVRAHVMVWSPIRCLAMVVKEMYVKTHMSHFGKNILFVFLFKLVTFFKIAGYKVWR